MKRICNQVVKATNKAPPITWAKVCSFNLILAKATGTTIRYKGKI